MSEQQPEAEAREFLRSLADSIYDPAADPELGELVPEPEAAQIVEPVSGVSVQL
jgi:hypothetical protein